MSKGAMLSWIHDSEWEAHIKVSSCMGSRQGVICDLAIVDKFSQLIEKCVNWAS